MLTADFDYHLPPELIASAPLPDRAASRMMVIHRDTGVIEHRHFSDLPSYLLPGDLFVLNNTRVIPARLFGERVRASRDGSGRAKVEVTLLAPTPDGGWQVMARRRGGCRC